MTHRDGKSIGRIKKLFFNFYAKYPLYHSGNLLLGRGTIATDGNLGFARCILVHRSSVMYGG